MINIGTIIWGTKGWNYIVLEIKNKHIRKVFSLRDFKTLNTYLHLNEISKFYKILK